MPPLSWNEIKSRALAFSRDWAEVASEDAEAKTFWNEFFQIFGISRRDLARIHERDEGDYLRLVGISRDCWGALRSPQPTLLNQ